MALRLYKFGDRPRCLLECPRHLDKEAGIGEARVHRDLRRAESPTLGLLLLWLARVSAVMVYLR
jgi:hypothetical protein